MSFELSVPPQYLEISDPSITIASQVDIIAEHRDHWAEAYDKSDTEIDPGIHDINAVFLGCFNDMLALDSERLVPRPEIYEKVRQYVSGLLATSGLARILLTHPYFKVEDPYAVNDTADEKAPAVLFNIEGVATFLHMTHKICTLILPEGGDITEQWYKDGDLFVRRTITTELSSSQQDWQEIKELNMRSDLTNMATLYPYLGRS